MQPEKLTLKSQEALSEAQRLARESSHQEMDGEHLLLALLGQSESLVPELLQKIGVAPAKLQTELERDLSRRHKVEGGAEVYASPTLRTAPRRPRPTSARTITSAPNICCSACWPMAVRR